MELLEFFTGSGGGLAKIIAAHSQKMIYCGNPAAEIGMYLYLGAIEDSNILLRDN